MTDLYNIFDDSLRPSKKYDLPKHKNAWIEFWMDYPSNYFDVMKEKEKEYKDKSDYYQWLTVSQLRDWNLSDGEKKLELNLENFKKLPIKVKNWIAEKSQEIMQESLEEFNKKKEK